MLNVTITYNHFKYLFDNDLSLKAKGFMALCTAYINSHGAYETFRLQDLERYYKESAPTIKAAMNELIDKGYVTRTRETFPDKQGISWEFTFLE